MRWTAGAPAGASLERTFGLGHGTQAAASDYANPAIPGPRAGIEQAASLRAIALGTISARVLEEPHRVLLSKPFSEEALLLKVQGLLEAGN